MSPAAAQNQNQNQNQSQTQSVEPQPQQTPVSTGSVHKEQEPVAVGKSEVIEHVSTEMEIPPEVEKAGVMKVGETIELPPDLRKLGVTHAGVSLPITSTPPSALPQITLPISDTQVVAGLHVQVVSALRWLAEWCMRRLKKAHIALKVAHGKVMRVKS